MLAGVPVLSSDIPGVRQPVVQTGFGTLVPPAATSRRSPAPCRSCTRTRRTARAASPGRSARSRWRTCSTRTRCCSTRPRSARRPTRASGRPRPVRRGLLPAERPGGRPSRAALVRPARAPLLRARARTSTSAAAPGTCCGGSRRTAARPGSRSRTWSVAAARATAPGATCLRRPRRPARRAAFGALVAVHVLEHLDDDAVTAALATLAAGAGARRPRAGRHARSGRPRPRDLGRTVGRVRRPDARQPQAARVLAGAAGRRTGSRVLREGSDGLWNVPYGRRYSPSDVVRAAPAFAQYLAGRLVLPPGSGESSVFVVERTGI